MLLIMARVPVGSAAELQEVASTSFTGRSPDKYNQEMAEERDV